MLNIRHTISSSKRSIALAALFTASLYGLHAKDILFVGNSFTFGPGGFKPELVNDLNGANKGGIPAILHAMAKDGGIEDLNINMETSGGVTLEWHIQSKSSVINKPWDVVILQDYSTRTLTTPSGGKGTNRASFYESVEKLTTSMREENESVEIILYQTWGRPDRVLAGVFPDIQTMQEEITEAYAKAAEDNNSKLARVGEAFMMAVEKGIADDPSTTEKEGPYSLWGGDKYHQGNYGAYLSAAIFYAKIFDKDPRELPTGAGSTRAALGLDSETAQKLLEIAYELASK